MEISAKELRGKPARIIEQAARGIEVIITLRGKKSAKLIPYKTDTVQNTDEDEIFGMWGDHTEKTSINEHVRNIRKGRKF
jgi:prevent-host-death family protein